MKKFMLSWILIALILSLAACGSRPADDNDRPGGITATAVWPSGSALGKSGTVMRKAPPEVAWVRMIVSKGTTTRQADFDALLGSGSISGVPAGTGWTLTFVGLNAAKNIVYYEGSKGGITVTAGQTTNAGSVAMRIMPGTSGMLDTTFGGDGMVITTIGANNSYASSIIQQTDGKLVVAGHADFQFSVARYNADGSLDTSFGGGGVATYATGTNGLAEAMVIQSDNKIIVAGRAPGFTGLHTALVRVLPNGTLDPGFASSGLLLRNISTEDSAYAVGLQADGTIVAAGYAVTAGNQDFMLLRSDASGSVISTTITPVGSNSDSGYALAIAADNSIYVAGDSFNGTNVDFALVKYNSDGAFVSKTTVSIGAGNNRARSIAIQPDGKVLIGGWADCSTGVCFGLVRYNSVGVLDPTFGAGGKLSLSYFNYPNYSADAIRILPDGKILVAGLANNATRWVFAIIRLNADGTLDQTFSPTNGPYIVLTPVGAGIDMNRNLAHLGMLAQSDGKIVIAANAAATGGGIQGYALARYWNKVSTTNSAYVANGSDRAVSVISLPTLTVSRVISLPSSSTSPSNMGISPATNRVYVVDNLGNKVSIIDTINNMVIGEITGLSNPTTVAINETTNRVYIANNLANNVSVIDMTDHSTVTTIPVGNQPRSVYLHPFMDRLYVSNGISASVSVIDTITNTVIATIPVGSEPRGISVDPVMNKIFVANYGNGSGNTVSVIDATTNSNIASVTVGLGPLRAAAHPTAGKVYVSNTSANTVSVINSSNYAVTPVTVGNTPQTIAIDGAANRAYVVVQSENAVKVLDTTNDSLLPSSIAVGVSPLGLAIAP